MDQALSKKLLCKIFKFKKATAQLSNSSDVSLNEVLAMTIVGSQSGKSEKSLLAAELGETLCITNSAVSQMLTSLEKKGFVYRDINASDKRQYRFMLTNEGRRVTQQMEDEIDKTMRRIILRFGEDRILEFMDMLDDFSEILTLPNENENTISK
ncbi:MAG: MarR family transcriptional regulator [Ethanoligenens sp.]